MFKFKIGDEVKITTGKDKGKVGKIEKIFAHENKLVVTGVNIYKRHRKVTRTQPAGIYEIARPLSTSTVAIICPKCGKPTRVGFLMEGKIKVRICKKCQGRLAQPKEKK